MIVVGGGEGSSSSQAACMLCSYDDSGKKIADCEGNEGDIRAMALSWDASILVTHSTATAFLLPHGAVRLCHYGVVDFLSFGMLTAVFLVMNPVEIRGTPLSPKSTCDMKCS